ncbi:MAG: DUF2089 domain-containing protein [Actinobacteria bacterium]|nr:DUF2089 domain-containing protein [Actinomycetota bacterium]
MPTHRHAPRDCPVCGTALELTRLSCPDCHTELSGAFAACEFCSLSADDRTLLRVFLASRGNMKDLERHLGVSYPTARARFDGLLGRLGIEVTRDAPAPEPSVDILDALARGEIDIEEASRRL